MARIYKQRKRATQQTETRQRIVEATVELHQAIGGLNTTISAIAERAGVERATVYRHFPDERALLVACTGHYLAQNPPPDATAWATIDEPVRRLRTALTVIYAYHRRTAPMSSRAAMDVNQMPVLREVLAPLFAYWQQVQRGLVADWPVASARAHRLEAVVGHAIAFSTWQSLVEMHGLTDSEAVDLMVQWVWIVGAEV